jgi:hypothetical protein
LRQPVFDLLPIPKPTRNHVAYTNPILVMAGKFFVEHLRTNGSSFGVIGLNSFINLFYVFYNISTISILIYLMPDHINYIDNYLLIDIYKV